MNLKDSFSRPLCSVDVVIFALVNHKLCVLLTRRPPNPLEPYRGKWALVGGFVDTNLDHDIKGTALRKLKEKTGVDTPYLEQLGSWGSMARDPRGWSVTIAFYALLPKSLAPKDENSENENVKWATIYGNAIHEELAFDHLEIFQAALERLRNKVEYTSLPAYLLDEKFTLSELQRTFEIIVGRKLEKSAFRTRINAVNLVTPIDEYRTGSNRPAQLYVLSKKGEPLYFRRTLNPVTEK